MNSYIQILCRFQKCKRKVPPPLLLLSNEKSPFTPKGRFFPSFGEVKGDFTLLRSDSGGFFCLHFWNLHKIWIQESIDLNSIRFGRRCNIGWVTSAQGQVSVVLFDFIIKSVNKPSVQDGTFWFKIERRLNWNYIIIEQMSSKTSKHFCLC